MTRIHCWVIIGQAGTRKGSVIRSLTGISRSTRCDIMLTSRQSLRFETAVMSGNEGANPTLPDAWLDEMAPVAGGAIIARTNLLVAFRLQMGIVGREAKDYLDVLAMNSSVTVETVLTLGEATPGWVRDYGIPYAHITNVDTPTNGISAQVRELWGWR